MHIKIIVVIVFKEITEKLSNQELSVNLQDNSEKDQTIEDLRELKRILRLIKGIEEKGHDLISKFEKHGIIVPKS